MIYVNNYKEHFPTIVGEYSYTYHLDCAESNGADHKKRLWLKRDSQGVCGYCHHCGEKGYYRDNSIFKSNHISIQESIENQVRLPEDFTNKLPGEALLYLFKYDISLHEIGEYIGWSKSLQRIIILIYDECGLLKYWQGRTLDPNNQVKWLGPKGVKSYPFYLENEYNRKRCVVVEDMISAIKVARSACVIALLGTYISPAARDLMINGNFKWIHFWLDQDASRKAVQYAKQVELYTNTSYIITDKDPKCYSDVEIGELIG